MHVMFSMMNDGVKLVQLIVDDMAMELVVYFKLFNLIYIWFYLYTYEMNADNNKKTNTKKNKLIEKFYSKNSTQKILKYIPISNVRHS